ncbi:MAG TPA: hypothetical protein PLR72_04620 [Paludibacteraceae bacterium]|nr:hypothetical protein [Paludibacteraceae bacterium]
MKKIKLIIGFFFLNFVLFAQNNQGKSDDAGRIVLTSVVSDQIEGLNPSAQSNLHNKLNQIATKNGMGGSSLNNRFIITANVVVLTKDVTATAPPMHAYTLEITLYIGDGIEGTLFSSTSVTLKGVGETETKAYMAALKNLKVDDPKYQSFIEQGKNKIIEYYNSKCDFILKEAEMLAGQNEFDAAISKLVDIPEVCKECYDKALTAIQPIYQKKIDRDCKIKLQEAQGIWNAVQDRSSAEKAGAILSTIEPDASCFAEVQALNKKIADKVKQIDDREWNYILKEQAQESERIEAYRAIGVAYGNNQPQNVTYNYKGWW